MIMGRRTVVIVTEAMIMDMVMITDTDTAMEVMIMITITDTIMIMMREDTVTMEERRNVIMITVAGKEKENHQAVVLL
eukprot:CAMPEP_0176408952 /NCGR_PEP_ID=MMETSP0127-20121128/2240_1 /TAXON_ID=938130 /ORGANISM="Platyophrya macrostoma, Strain WH" /LENGTH=77 /DNA_ID=CAMNT_0017788301 /DNA_START=389 /DNA_END=622 /DNA_ORIENTATION=+